ncbi:MAG: LacI family DNA-binding transcriptional regulator [Solirubrobacteraceae bacterium]
MATERQVKAARQRVMERRPGDPRKPVTMIEVAAAAGVAQSTVSRILNDAPGMIAVSEVTRDRVKRIAGELGYSPHPIARALRGAPTMLLGAIVRDITDPFFTGAVEALTIACRARGYSVVLGNARATEDEALEMTAVLEARQCDGIVLFGDFTAEHRLVEDLRDVHARVVGLWHGAENEHPFPTVGVNNRSGARAALDHLWELGHRNIAYVGAEQLGDMQERQAGYLEWMGEHGLTVADGNVQMVPNFFGGGNHALAPILDQQPRVTAVFAATDTLAVGLLHAAHRREIHVPERLSVVGFDDISMAAVTVPSLTTVRMPVVEIVARGVELCIGSDLWSGGWPPPRETFEPTLVVRGSSGPVDG